jgi:hypothetical protein
MSWYRVDLVCKCGRVHRICNELQIPDGPTRAGSLEDLYPSGKLPPVLIEKMGDLMTCDAAEGYTPIGEMGRLMLTPAHGWPPVSQADIDDFLQYLGRVSGGPSHRLPGIGDSDWTAGR